ncbi:unnamed protein product [Brachionus calyciflorus]|uniref:Ubiquitin-like protease family profile domain-containing protein n=1 Tax=Brachionus calyciflorus TaxID=104777 RepID=A0A813Y7L7_9BILA|nr:unnamed protein product [Brachionus calyciflorus]
MPRTIHFPDEQKLICITVKFMRDKNLIDLEGGYRPKNNPFQQITSIYSNGEFESSAPASLYSKWKKNYNNFRSNVMNRLKEGSNISDDPMDNYEIILDQNEWNKINKSIGGITRKKFLASVNPFFSKKIRSLGFECDFKLKSNYFSTAKKKHFGKKIWNGVFVCKNCSKEISGLIDHQNLNNNDIHIKIESNDFNCFSKKEATGTKIRITGDERRQLQYEISSKGSSNFWNEANFFQDERKISLSYDSVRKMNSQHRHRFQLAHDLRIDSDASKNIFDSFLSGSRNRLKGYIQEVHSNPYGALLFAEIQIKMWEIVRENNPIWFFDATGNLMTRLKNQKEILLYTILVHDTRNKTSFPVADFLSSANDSISIYSFLIKIIEKFSLFPFFQKPKLIVTDFSWANIHAISKSFNNMEIIDYIFLSYKIIVESKLYMTPSIKTLIYLCSTHFLKNIIDETDRIIKKNSIEDGYLIRKRFIKSFILLQNCNDFEIFCKLLLSIKNVFMSKQKDQNYLIGIAHLTLAQKELDFDFFKNLTFPEKKEHQDTEEIPKIFFVENRNINLVKDSPFTGYFKKILEPVENEEMEKTESEKNAYYNPDLFKIIVRRLHILPLWSAIMFRNFHLDKTRYSNNAVERWFGYFKNKILMTNKRVRNCRLLFLNEVATPLFFTINQKYKEYYEEKFNEKHYQLEQKQIDVEQSKASTEKYSFKNPTKTKISHYLPGYNFIKNESEAVKEVVDNYKLSDLKFSNFFEEEEETTPKADQKMDIDKNYENNNNFESKETIPLERHKKKSVFGNDLFSESDRFYENLIGKKSENSLTKMFFEINNVIIDDFFVYKVEDILINKREINSLINNEWLSDTILEAYGKAVVLNSQREVGFISSFYCTEISYNGFLRFHHDLKIYDKDAIFGFLNQNKNHWCLVFIDLRNNFFNYIDPLGETKGRQKKFFQNWNFYFQQQYKINLIQDNIEHSLQKDSINCGVFVCFFLNQLLNNKPLIINNSIKNIFDYRMLIMNVLKGFSAKSFCSYCGENLTEKDDVLYGNCNHKYHNECKLFKEKYSLKLKEFEEFDCPICF